MANLEEHALEIIRIIDYDVYKECLNEIKEDGQSATVNEIVSYLETINVESV